MLFHVRWKTRKPSHWYLQKFKIHHLIETAGTYSAGQGGAMNISTLTKGIILAGAISVTSGAQAQAQTAPAVAETKPAVNVVIQPGDSLTKIATDHATTYSRLYDANLSIVHPDVIHPGESVRIPSAEEQLVSRPLPSVPEQSVAATYQPPTQQTVAPRVAVATGDAWSRLANCESGGNPSTNTGNGYYGAYQFSASTWSSVGGSGLPHQASYEEQTARAQMLQARSGWGQWPSCSSQLGLR